MTERNVKDDPSQTCMATICFITDTLDLMPQELRHMVAGYLTDSLENDFVNVILTNPWRRLFNADAKVVEGNVKYIVDTLKGVDPDRDRVVDRIRSNPGPRRMEY